MSRMQIKLALVLTALASTSVLAQIKSVDGRVPEARFERVVAGGDGRFSLSEFHGRPILIEFWGTR